MTMTAFVEPVNSSGDGSDPFTRHIPMRVRSFSRSTASRTCSSTAPDTLARVLNREQPRRPDCHCLRLESAGYETFLFFLLVERHRVAAPISPRPVVHEHDPPLRLGGPGLRLSRDPVL